MWAFKIICAFVPWNANALIPLADIFPAVENACVRSLNMLKAPLLPFREWFCLNTSTRCGFTLSRCNIEWKLRVCIFFAENIKPTIPDAGSVWPTNDFAPEITNARWRGSKNTALAAPTSIGSPKEVPVPCSSIPSIDEKSKTLTERRALRITLCCEGPFGAVSELDLPSWFVADPPICAVLTLSIEFSPTSKFMNNAAQASPRTYPSALASKTLHLPSLDSIPALLNISVVTSLKVTLDPQDIDELQSFVLIVVMAKCNPTNDEEHAVSTLTQIPWRPKI